MACTYSLVILVLFVSLPDQLVAVFEPRQTNAIFNQAAPLAAWLALVAFILIFSGIFYLRYRSGKWKTLSVVRDGS
jgi:MATE family multidrug resistance protein